jgi:hypothetical protein
MGVYVGIAELGPRIGLSGEYLEGAYLFPFAGYVFSTGGMQVGNVVELGMEAGYSWIWPSGFMISTSAGFCILFSPEAGGGSSSTIPRLVFNLGYAW